jgi:hypothetical protein
MRHEQICAVYGGEEWRAWLCWTGLGRGLEEARRTKAIPAGYCSVMYSFLRRASCSLEVEIGLMYSLSCGLREEVARQSELRKDIS